MVLVFKNTALDRISHYKRTALKEESLYLKHLILDEGKETIWDLSCD